MFKNCPWKPRGFENDLESKPEGPQLTVPHELVKGTVILNTFPSLLLIIADERGQVPEVYPK